MISRDQWLPKRENDTDDKITEELIERLAALEHRQWMSWSRYVAEHHDILRELEEKWESNWIPYSELTDEEKEKDRKWAREVVEMLDDQGVTITD